MHRRLIIAALALALLLLAVGGWLVSALRAPARPLAASPA
jgi:hypothetical protein